MADNQEQAEAQKKAADREEAPGEREQAAEKEQASGEQQAAGTEKDLELAELEPQARPPESDGDPGEDSDEDGSSGGPASAHDLEAVYDIPVQVSAVLGRATMQVSQLLKLGRGAVVELDRKVGEAIDIYVNDRLVARGEVVVVDDRLGVTMTEIIKADRSR